MLKEFIFSLVVGLLVTKNAWSAGLAEQFSNQQKKQQSQIKSQRAGEEVQLLSEVRESLSTFLETFNGKPRMIGGKHQDYLFKTVFTSPVGYLLDGDFILRLDSSKTHRLGAPSYAMYNVPRLTVVGRISSDGSAELIDKNQVVLEAEFKPHPKTIAENMRGSVDLYIKRGNRVSKYNWWVNPVYDTAPIVTKYYELWGAFKAHREGFPRAVIAELESFHRDYGDFCRYYFRGKYANRSFYCQPW